MRNHRLFLVPLSLLILFSSQAFPQHHTPAKPQASKSAQLTDSAPIPVVHGSKDDGLPDRIRVHGIITDLTFADAYCGAIAWAGTLKIKLLNRIVGYRHEDVFVVVPCFLDTAVSKKEYLDKTVSLEVAKLYGKKEGSCYFEIATNRIDSKGVPFYCTGLGQNEILKIIAQENTRK